MRERRGVERRCWGETQLINDFARALDYGIEPQTSAYQPSLQEDLVMAIVAMLGAKTFAPQWLG